MLNSRRGVILLLLGVLFHFGVTLHQGDICRGGLPVWRCRALDSCPQAVEAQHGRISELCGFEGEEPLVCCPPWNIQPQRLSPVQSNPLGYSHGSWGGGAQGQVNRPENMWLSGSAEGARRPATRPPNVWSGGGEDETKRPPNRPKPPGSNTVWSGGNRETTTKRDPWGSGWVTPSDNENSWEDRWTTRPTTRRPTKPPWNQVQETRSRKMCRKYAAFVYRDEESPTLVLISKPRRIDECGRKAEALIVGGQDALPKEFPHMARIGYGEKSRIEWLCGGSLISERFILSAAHCTSASKRGDARWANLGDLDTGSDQDDASPLVVRIVERINHPDYGGGAHYNDIALFKLENNIQLGPYIRPICLHTSPWLSGKAIASGWGHTAWGGRGSNMLKKVSLNLVDTVSCNDTYRRYIGGAELPRGIVGNYMVCAGDVQGKDTCQGDSGGPLQIPLDDPYCMYSLVGVTSFGIGCGQGTPGVYTKVSHYVPWIENIVWPS